MPRRFARFPVALTLLSIQASWACHHNGPERGPENSPLGVRTVSDAVAEPREVSATTPVPADERRVELLLEELRVSLVRTTIEKDVSERMKHYAPNVVSMPEYQRTLLGVDAVAKYYTEIFQRQNINAFERQITEVFNLGETVLELGTFRIEYVELGSGESLVREGKYWNVWAREAGGALKIKAETWGYFLPVNNPNTVTMEIEPLVATSPPHELDEADENLRFELHALNALMQEGVRNKDAQLRSSFYSRNAVFMPHADSTKSGLEEIQKHLVEYSRGDVVLDTVDISTFVFERAGEYVIEYPRFRVEWHVDQMSGVTSGKGIRLWRREPGGTLKIYREIATHDFLG